MDVTGVELHRTMRVLGEPRDRTVSQHPCCHVLDPQAGSALPLDLEMQMPTRLNDWWR